MGPKEFKVRLTYVASINPEYDAFHFTSDWINQY
jgi:hypothetical protein